jgi:5-methylcytosine-specific restriction endonuclease McrA
MQDFGFNLIDDDDKPKKRNIPRDIKERVWQRFFPNVKIGKCYVCDDPVLYRNFDVGHVKAKAEGGQDNLNNLRVICRPCNSAMKTMNLEAYKRKFYSHLIKESPKESTERKVIVKKSSPRTKSKKKKSHDPMMEAVTISGLKYAAPKKKKKRKSSECGEFMEGFRL